MLFLFNMPLIFTPIVILNLIICFTHNEFSLERLDIDFSKIIDTVCIKFPWSALMASL